MDRYQTLIGVVLEKLDQSYKDLQMTRGALAAALQGHSDEELRSIPELITIADMLQAQEGILAEMEARFPGLRKE